MKAGYFGIHELLATFALIHGKPSREFFTRQASRFINDALPTDEFLALCDWVIANGHAGNDPAYEAEVHAFRAIIYWERRELLAAQKDAQKAVFCNPDSLLAHQVLYSVCLARNKHRKAAAALEAIAALTSDTKDRKRFQNMAKDLFFRGTAVDAAAMMRSFLSNEAAANTKYGGRMLAVSGRVIALTVSSLGWPVAVLSGKGGASPAVRCLFDRHGGGGYASLSEGMAVMIAGNCSGLLRSLPQVRDCRVINAG